MTMKMIRYIGPKMRMKMINYICPKMKIKMISYICPDPGQSEGNGKQPNNAKCLSGLEGSYIFNFLLYHLFNFFGSEFNF